MGAVVAIAAADLKDAWRDFRLPVLTALSLVLALVAAWTSVERVTRLEAERAAAHAQERETWLGQGAANPHTIAHFSQVAMKPATPLAAFDPGVNAELGATIWMEAHWQNPANNRAAEDTLEAQRFADLTPAWTPQLIAPLVIAALGFPLLARARESGLWRSLAASGVSPSILFAAKFTSLLLLSLLALSPLIAAALWAPIAADAPEAPDQPVRAAWLVGLYGLYLLAVLALTLAVSAWARTARFALAALSGLIIAIALIAPRAITSAADLASPAPTVQAFDAILRQGLEAGIDGHNPADARAEALEQRVLAQYGVARVEDLPVSFAGISLQAGEEHANTVFDHHFNALYGAYARQRAIARAWSWISPSQALSDASMTLTGADDVHHRHFSAAAESHRRSIIRQLNEDMVANARGLDFDYVANPALWAAVPDFAYAPPALNAAARAHVSHALLVLSVWTLLALLLAFVGVRRWAKA